jgi:hypothetical protein
VTSLTPTPALERRIEPRHIFGANVLVIPQDTRFERFWATTANISRGGMYVLTDRPVPTDLVVLTKIVPQGSSSIHATGRVVHRRDGLGFGCCFVRLSPQNAARLDRWLGRTGGLAPVSGKIEN